MKKDVRRLLRDFVYGKPHGERRLGELYEDKTGLYRHREWRGIVDTNYAFYRWLRLFGVVAKRAGPNMGIFVKGLLRYRWMRTYACGFAWVDRGNEGLRGPALRVGTAHYEAMFDDSVRQLVSQFRADANLHGGKRTAEWYTTIAHDETIAGHLFYGFPELTDDILIQLTPCFLQPHVCKQTIPHYIDAVESIGLPADPCPLCAAEAGLCVMDDYPDFSPVLITTNMACDGSVGTSIVQDMYFDKPLYAMPTPMRYDEKGVQKYMVDELMGAIAFLEEHLNMKFDWDAFFRGLEGYNELTRFELEKWEVTAKTDFYPVSGVAQALYRIYYFQIGNRPIWHRTDAYVRKIMEKCVRRGIRPFPMARHRALIWSCAPLYYSYFPIWLYNCWGISVVINMDSLMGHNIIRTDTKEHALYDLAVMYERAPMRTMAVGGQEHILDLFNRMEQFNADLVIMYDQVACKAMDGIHGIFEDEFRHRNIHAIWVPHELMDQRTVDRPEMRRAVNDYMTTILHEEPLDPSLLEFDDTLGW